MMYGHYYLFPGFDIATFVWMFPLILIDLVLKGFALWKASKNNHLYWFIALLVINSLGILPLVYLLIIDKKKKS